MAHRAFSDTSLARLGTRLREIRSMAESAASLSGEVATLSGLTADALTEYNTLLETKQNLPIRGTITVPTTGWTSDSGVGGRFTYKITVALADVEASDKVNLILSDDLSIAAAGACGLADWTESVTGAVKLRATKAPTQSFTVGYAIMKPQA